jgi:hypothetical protein
MEEDDRFVAWQFFGLPFPMTQTSRDRGTPGTKWTSPTDEDNSSETEEPADYPSRESFP